MQLLQIKKSEQKAPCPVQMKQNKHEHSAAKLCPDTGISIWCFMFYNVVTWHDLIFRDTKNSSYIDATICFVWRMNG